MRIAFFNNKGGVGKTTLVYHLAHMMAEQGHQVLMVDLDPQSNLTAMCLSEDRLEELWPVAADHRLSVLGCLQPILRGMGAVQDPHIEPVAEGLGLAPGDMGLAVFEDKLSEAWSRALFKDEAAFSMLSSFHRLASLAAKQGQADIVFFDLGPNLGAINRTALLAVDFVVTPLAPDLFSMMGLRKLGPTLIDWRQSWQDRLDRSPVPDLDPPARGMQPLGYIVMQAGMRLSRPVQAYERWVRRLPSEYHESVIRDAEQPASADADPWCLGVMKHYQYLMPLAHDAQKPMFQLRPADGAIGAHMAAVQRCRADFDRLARKILRQADEAIADEGGD